MTYRLWAKVSEKDVNKGITIEQVKKMFPEMDEKKIKEHLKVVLLLFTRIRVLKWNVLDVMVRILGHLSSGLSHHSQSLGSGFLQKK